MIEAQAPYHLQVIFHIPVEEAQKILKDNGVILPPEFRSSALVEVVVTALDCPQGFRVDIITAYDPSSLELFSGKKSIMLKTENPAFEELIQKAKETVEKFYPGFWK